MIKVVQLKETARVAKLGQTPSLSCVERTKLALGKNATTVKSFCPFAPFDWGKTVWEMDGKKIY